MEPPPEFPTLLSDAAQALEAIAQGQSPDRAHVLAGTAALDALSVGLLDAGDRELIDDADAAQRLLQLASAGNMDLDEVSRARAARVARKLRELVSRS